MKDLTDHYQRFYPLTERAEQEGSNVLILFRLEEPRPFDLDKKKTAAFELSYRWLRNMDDLTWSWALKSPTGLNGTATGC